MSSEPTITQADRDVFEDIATLLLRYAIGLHPDVSGTIIKSLAKHRESSVAELQAEVERLREALQMAAKQFRFYEESHLLKETTDGIAKAVANRRCAEQCEIALAQKEPVE